MQKSDTVKLQMDVPAGVYYKIAEAVLAKKVAGDKQASIRKSCLEAITQSVFR